MSEASPPQGRSVIFHPTSETEEIFEETWKITNRFKLMNLLKSLLTQKNMKKINKIKRPLSRSLLAEERLVFLCEGSNQKLVQLLTEHPGLSIKQIALRLNLAPTDVFQRLQKMTNFQLVFESQPERFSLNQHKLLRIASLCQALNEPVVPIKRN